MHFVDIIGFRVQMGGVIDDTFIVTERLVSSSSPLLLMSLIISFKIINIRKKYISHRQLEL